MSLSARFASRKRIADTDDRGLSAYEVKRSRNIAENKAALEALGLSTCCSSPPSSSMAAARSGKKKKSPITKVAARHKLDPLAIWSKAAPPPSRGSPAAPRIGQRISDHFMCESDVACEVCAEVDDETGNDILLCDGDGCKAAYHMRCLNPPLSRVPRKEWLCPACAPAPSPCLGSPARFSSPARISTAAPRENILPVPSSAAIDSLNRRSDPDCVSAPGRSAFCCSPLAASHAARREAIRLRRAECESVLRHLRQELLLSAVPDRLLCREAQMEAIMDFALKCLSASKGGAMYIAGSPGLGKSMTVREAFRQLISPSARCSTDSAALLLPQHRRGAAAAGASAPLSSTGEDVARPHRSCFLNAFQLQTPAAVYAALLREMGIDQASIGAATSPRQALQHFIAPNWTQEEPCATDGSAPGSEEGGSRRLRAPPSDEFQPARLGRAVRASGGDRAAAAASSGVRDAVSRSRRGDANGMCLVVIDELDQLLGGDHEALHTLFEWAAAPSSKLVLLGIANSLDMMQRSLPRLRARRAVPQTLTFPPYAPEELVSILTQRVAQAIAVHRSSGEANGREARSGTQPASPVRGRPIAPVVASPTSASGSRAAEMAGEEAAASSAAGPTSCSILTLKVGGADVKNPVVEHAAMVFCARKVAAASGDARRALQVFGMAAESAAEELRQWSLVSPSRSASSSASAAAGGTQPVWLEKPALRFDHMSSALGAAFKSRVIALLESLPQHQQLLLCALVLRGRKVSAPNAQCTLADLHASYKRMCSSQRLPHLPANEVLPICHNMAACGVFGIGDIGGRSLSRANAPARRSADLSTPVWLAIAEDDLKAATQELRFFRNLLCT